MRDLSRCVRQPTVSNDGFVSLSTATYRASTIVFATAEEYRQRKMRGPDGYSYGMNGTPTSRTLDEQIAALENARHCILAPSGMSAISLVMLSVLQQGDKVLIPDTVYPPVKKFCAEFLSTVGISHGIYKPDGSNLENLLGSDVRLIWMESPGSTTMEVQDIRAIAARAKELGILVGCDNTWATPLLLKPLDLGVDFSMQALTKYAGGHSDLLMGSVAVNDDLLYAKLKETRTTLGIGVSPDDCSLALRGIATMGVRLNHVGRVALELASYMSCYRSVVRTLHPAFEDCPGHDIWQREAKGCSGTFSVEIATSSVAVLDEAISQAKFFSIGASWGGTHSLMVPMTVDDQRLWHPAQPGTTYVRLSIGLEDENDLREDIHRVFSFLDAAVEQKAPTVTSVSNP